MPDPTQVQFCSRLARRQTTLTPAALSSEPAVSASYHPTQASSRISTKADRCEWLNRRTLMRRQTGSQRVEVAGSDVADKVERNRVDDLETQGISGSRCLSPKESQLIPVSSTGPPSSLSKHLGDLV